MLLFNFALLLSLTRTLCYPMPSSPASPRADTPEPVHVYTPSDFSESELWPNLHDDDDDDDDDVWPTQRQNVQPTQRQNDQPTQHGDENLSNIDPELPTAGKTLKNKFQDAGNNVKSKFPAQKFQAAGATVKNKFQDAGKNVRSKLTAQKFQDAGETVKNKFQDAGKNVKSKFPAQKFQAAGVTVKNKFQDAGKNVKNKFSSKTAGKKTDPDAFRKFSFDSDDEQYFNYPGRSASNVNIDSPTASKGKTADEVPL